jgi:6-pyruvoyltetrahydropterin/6-carboxytetrahydropterin synthase
MHRHDQGDTMTYTISKEFAFSASHRLTGLPDGHPCSRLHGHNYLIVIKVSASYLDRVGFVIDYGDLAPFRDWIDDHLDHRHLNDVFGPDTNPTAENLADLLADVARDVLALPPEFRLAIGVSETPKTWAWWET